MKHIDDLNTKLLKQPFTSDAHALPLPEEFLSAASVYARTENAIAVLSDMKANRSYIHYGRVAERLGMEAKEEVHIIPSIWEKEILDRIHPDDLSAKYVEELRFYHFMKNLPHEARPDYYLSNPIRMRTALGEYIPVLHRMFYLSYDANGCARFSLCLYQLLPNASTERLIVNSVTGETLKSEEQDCSRILSRREVDVLRLIEQGKMSKDIADILCISIHTVSRHRQSILQKLQVDNSMEACRVARNLRLIG